MPRPIKWVLIVLAVIWVLALVTRDPVPSHFDGTVTYYQTDQP